MNETDVNKLIYAKKVELLLRLVPVVMEEGVFAIHGGSAINLFLKDLPRYSVDIDLTYIPLADRTTSINDINMHLKSISDKAKRAIKGMHITPKFDTCKLLCEYQGRQVKIEVNQTKRGIVGGDVLTLPLSNKAQNEFSLYCEAKVGTRACHSCRVAGLGGAVETEHRDTLAAASVREIERDF